MEYQKMNKTELRNILSNDPRICPDGKFPVSLLGNPEEHFKLKKNVKENGVLSFPLNGSPAMESGFNTCANSTAICRELCLHFSGITFQFKNKDSARRKRTRAYFLNRPIFSKLLKLEIDSAFNRAESLGLDVGFRPNTTTDLIYESVRFDCGESVPEYILNRGGYIYDYTKYTNRHIKKNFPAGYHLTFSYSGDNWSDCIEAHKQGLNVAIPFSSEGKKIFKPAFFLMDGKPVKVIDGDKTDFRPSDEKGVIVGLDYKYNKQLKTTRSEQLKYAIQNQFCIDVENDLRVVA